MYRMPSPTSYPEPERKGHPWLPPGKKKYFHTEHTDRIIREAYQSPRFGRKKNAAIRQMVATLGWPKHVCYYRALALGVIQPRGRIEPWSEEETELLEQWSHCHPRIIAKKFKAAGYARTESAIALRVKRECGGIRQCRVDAGILSGGDIARLLGVSTNIVSDWAANGILKGKKVSEDRNGRWEIRESELRRFIFDNPSRVNLARVDKIWFLELMRNQ